MTEQSEAEFIYYDCELNERKKIIIFYCIAFSGTRFGLVSLKKKNDFRTLKTGADSPMSRRRRHF